MDVFEYAVPILKGTLVTIELCLIAGVLGTAFGLLVGLASTARFLPLRYVALLYSNVIRGIPLIVILLFTYFALPLIAPGATFSQLASGSAGLSVFVSGYVAEIFRGSLLAVPRGQGEAADTLRLGTVQKYRYVIVPQALRVFVPPWIGTMLGMIKDSSLVSVIGLVDLTLAAKLTGSATLEPLGMFVAAAVIYFVLCYPVSAFGRWCERRLTPHERPDPSRALLGAV